MLGYVVLSFIIRWYNRNRTTKCLKRLQKRSIDDNLRQLVLIRQDRVLVNQSTCFFTSDSEFFLLFQKNGSVGRWETKHFMGMALLITKGFYAKLAYITEKECIPFFTQNPSVTCNTLFIYRYASIISGPNLLLVPFLTLRAFFTFH